MGCCIYVTYLLLVVLYICIRIYVFTAHQDWLASVKQFPMECSDWTQLSEQGGCTRLVLREAGCVRAMDLRDKSTIIYNVEGSDDKLAKTIETCVKNHNMG